jgi:ribosomal protein S18 acetylase RimI-like enzyme
MYSIFDPNEENNFDKYLTLRWRILRFPWGGERGSESDNLEDISIHRAIKNNKNDIIGVGRMHFIDHEAQIRYMAIKKSYRGKGLGTRMIKELEKVAYSNKIKRIFLNSRENAIKFYEKNGYKIINEVESSFGGIIHYRMEKT